MCRGLQNLHPPVQIWVLPLLETPHIEGFLCFCPNLELSPIGVNQPNIGVYWGRFGVNYWGKDSNFALMTMVKASVGTPQIKNSNGRLQVVLSQGGKRSYLSLSLPDSKQNRAYAQTIATQILNVA